MADPSGHGGYGHYHQQQQIPQPQQQQQYYYQMGHPAASSDSSHQQMQMAAGYSDGHVSRVMAVQQQGLPSMRSNSPAQMSASYQDPTFQSASPMFGFSRDGAQMQPGLSGPTQHPSTASPQQMQIGHSYSDTHVSRSFASQQGNPPAQSTSSVNMGMYTEGHLSRPLAAVQNMGPGRPLTPTMPIHSPASAPIMRSASPLVPYANYPTQADSPAVNMNGSTVNTAQPRRHITSTHPITSAPAAPLSSAPLSLATTAAPTTVMTPSAANSATPTSSRSHRPTSSHRKSSSMKPSPQQQPASWYFKTGIYLVRKLRSEMMKRMENPEMSAAELAKNAKEIERLYVDLERLAQQNLTIPESVATRGVFNLAATQDQTMEVLDSAVDAILIDECYEASIANHCEHLRMELSNVRPVASQFKKTEITFHNVNETHEQFESAVRHMIRDRETQKSHNYRISLHPCGLMCSLVEIELSKRKDPVFVAQIKATIFVQYGQLIFVRLGSPSEQLISDEETVKDSRYEVFRKISTFASSRLSSSATSARLASPNHISAVITFLQLFTLCFTTPCCKCKKLMKDFLPPTRIADVNVNKPLFQHESCE